MRCTAIVANNGLDFALIGEGFRFTRVGYVALLGEGDVAAKTRVGMSPISHINLVRSPGVSVLTTHC